MENENENSDPINKEQWYDKTKEYWKSSENTVQGVLCGNDNVHASDVKTSCELLEGFIKTGKLIPKRVIDCGAGIGRVTSDVLIKYFEECDIVEQDEKFVETCKNNFKDEPKVKDIYQHSLQNFEFKKKYNVIWIQWCLENLEDNDLTDFLIKCKSNLEKDGMVIIKENIVTRGTIFLQRDDYSKIRSDIIFKKLIEKSELKIYKHFHHPNWPKDLLKVSVFVLV